MVKTSLPLLVFALIRPGEQASSERLIDSARTTEDAGSGSLENDFISPGSRSNRLSLINTADQDTVQTQIRFYQPLICFLSQPVIFL